MKIILLEKITKLGDQGEIIEVKNGYAKNFLIPREKALLANKKNILLQKEIVKSEKYKDNSFSNIAANLSNITIIVPVLTKENDELYVTITSNNFIKILKSLNLEIKQKNLTKEILIRECGNYTIEIKKENNEITYIYLIAKKIIK